MREGGARCFDRLSNRAPAGQAMRARPFDGLSNRAPSGPSTGSGTGRVGDKGPVLRQAQQPGTVRPFDRLRNRPGKR